jgi:hypothetical protein
VDFITPHSDHTAHYRESHGFGVFGGIARLTVQDGAAPTSAVAGFVENFLQTLADECLGRGADLIGHLKAHVSTPHGTLRASLVDPQAGPAVADDLRGDTFAAGELAVNAVVHGLTDEDVAASVHAAAAHAAIGGLSVEWEHAFAHRSD